MSQKFPIFYIILIIHIIIFSCESEIKSGKSPNEKTVLDLSILSSQLEHKKQIIELDNYFKSLYFENIFSGTVIVAKNGVPFYRKAFGFANRKKRIPVDCDYAFQLGSVSKQFTAISILILEQKGLLNLDDSVQRFFPEFPYKNVSIHSLLTHLAGLPNYIYFCDNMPLNKEKTLSNKEMMKIMCDSFPEKYYPPNKSYHYCNTNYAVLASIVEKVSHQSFETFVRKEIFEPLEMTHSFFYSEINLFKDQPIATGYLSPRIEAGFLYLNGVTGDKGIFSTLDDMLRWDIALYSDKIIKREFSQKALQPQSRTRLHNIYYGYGWKMYYPDDSIKVLFHSGWWQGYQSVIMRIPKDTITVVVLKNKKTAHPINQSIILDILFPQNDFFKKKDKKSKEIEETEEME